MTTPDPFPNELVEAAAVLLDGMTCERCDGEGYIEIHDPNAAHADNPDGSHDEYCPDCCASGRAGFRKAAARIEQRVIDRLAREAGEPPSDYPSMPHAACWKKGAAAGVAAERERTATVLREMADRVEADRREPDKILCHVLTARRAAADLIERGGE